MEHQQQNNHTPAAGPEVEILRALNSEAEAISRNALRGRCALGVNDDFDRTLDDMVKAGRVSVAAGGGLRKYLLPANLPGTSCSTKVETGPVTASTRPIEPPQEPAAEPSAQEPECSPNNSAHISAPVSETAPAPQDPPKLRGRRSADAITAAILAALAGDEPTLTTLAERSDCSTSVLRRNVDALQAVGRVQIYKRGHEVRVRLIAEGDTPPRPEKQAEGQGARGGRRSVRVPQPLHDAHDAPGARRGEGRRARPACGRGAGADREGADRDPWRLGAGGGWVTA